MYKSMGLNVYDVFSLREKLKRVKVHFKLKINNNNRIEYRGNKNNNKQL